MTLQYRNVFAIVLGASQFPNFTSIKNQGGDAFKASAHKFIDCLRQLYGSDWISSNIHFLNLFDSTSSQDEQIKEIGSFLQNADGENHHLIVFYVGHGGFLEQDEYFLTIRNTREQYERTSGLIIKALADVIKLTFTKGNLYLILDCCFAGAAVNAFQSNTLTRKVKTVNELAFPKVGTSVLCASSKDSVALSKGTSELTQFSECLTEILEQGVQKGGEFLTLRLITDSVRERVRRFGYNRVDPDLHSPRQVGTDAADHPFIPNAAYLVDRRQSAMPSSAESEQIDTATISNSNGPSPSNSTVKALPGWVTWKRPLPLALCGIIVLIISVSNLLFTQIPDLVGGKKEEVLKILEERGFKVSLHEVDSDTAGLGEVIKLEPSSGNWVRKGSEIRMSVVDKPPVVVPRVENLTMDLAVKRLSGSGFKIETKYIDSESVVFGNVIEQSPKGGLTALSGANITITVSNGLSENTVRALQKEFRRLGYIENVDSQLKGEKLTDILKIQRYYGLSRKSLAIPTLLQKLRSMVKVPEFSNDNYEIVKRELNYLGLKAKRKIISRDSFGIFCAILVKTYLRKSTIPVSGAIVEKGSEITVNVHEKWSTKPDPHAVYPDCARLGYEKP